jgi:hypothetical protein
VPNPSKYNPQIAWRVGVTPWSIDDCKWLEHSPHRAHRVRRRFRDESFCHDRERDYPPSCDGVAVQPLEAGRRLRVPFMLPPSPSQEWLRKVSREEAGAHSLFDLAMKHCRDCVGIEPSTIAATVEQYSASGTA